MPIFSLNCLDILRVNLYALYKETAQQEIEHTGVDDSNIQNHNHFLLEFIINSVIRHGNIATHRVTTTHKLYTNKQLINIIAPKNPS